MADTTYRWKFFRAGGFDQVNLLTGQDLANLDQLDQKLWVTLSCPTRGLEFDPKTLELIDTDKDGSIRAPEILAATRWACARVKNPGVLLRGSASLDLDQIDESTPEGRQLLASARRILANLNKSTPSISLDDTTDTVRIFAATQFNGDGVVTLESTSDAALKTVIADIIACLGPEADRSGKPGINQAKVDAFFAEATAFSQWMANSEADTTVLATGPGTAAAAAAVNAVRAKVEDYFVRCRLAAFDPRAVPALNREEGEYVTLAARDLVTTAAEITALPLAHIQAGKPLSLTDGVNPGWATLVGRLQTDAVLPLLGARQALTEADWTALLAKLEPYESWLASKAGAVVEKLGLARIRDLLASNARQALTELVARDRALETEANFIAAVDKLVRLNRDLFKLLVNFVNFSDFYNHKDKAIFQAGTLYLDQRSCDLCIRVEDPGKHAAMAGLAGTYLAYCDCVRRSTGEKVQIVAAFTDGDADNLMTGRNGIFYDRKGQDWDATITRIVDNPISIRQAFWAPYKKLVRLIEEQVAKRAAAAEAASRSTLETVAINTANVDKAKPAELKRIDVGTVAALGVAVGAIGSAASALAVGLLKLDTWQIPLLFAALVLCISLPSVLIAWLKLRNRNLSPILDANGWALNAKALINVSFGRSLTEVAKLPPGAQRNLIDPFADKKSPWPRMIILLLFLFYLFHLLNNMGLLYKWSGENPIFYVPPPPRAPAGTNAVTPPK